MMKTELRIGTYMMSAAEFPQENPLPPLNGLQNASTSLEAEENHSHDIYSMQTLPYLLQDGYDRQRKLRAFKVAILENDFLRATFLLELGGRLWSLFHKPAQRELLFVNPIFQPANLAIRDAWFSGGIEWNISVIGHSPLTCAPMFAASVQGDDGSPVLRLYEWERIRCVPFQLDFILPPESPLLFSRVRIINPHKTTIPMYWWSNIAVPQTDNTRVLGPADKLADRAPVELLHQGSGWGALEQRRRVRMPEVDFASCAIPFDNATLGQDQQPWLHLLDHGVLPVSDPAEPPTSYMVQPEWRALLEKAVADSRNHHWLSWLHLGVMRYQQRDYAGARLAWQQSVALTSSAWALRNLAFLAHQRGNLLEAADLYMRAIQLSPQTLPLMIESLPVFLQANRPQDICHLVSHLSPAQQQNGRIRLIQAQAALQCGDLETAKSFLETPVEFPNIREGELSLTEVWYEYHEKLHIQKTGCPLTSELRASIRRDNPPPMRLDFRMNTEAMSDQLAGV